MAEKEGKTPKDLSSDGPKAERAAARDAAHAAHDAEVAERHDAVVAERNAAAAEDGQATAIDSGVAAEPAELPEEIEAGLPTEPAPEEGTLGQAPVLTPSTFAPISSQPLPNAQRDATKIATDLGTIGDAPVAGRSGVALDAEREAAAGRVGAAMGGDAEEAYRLAKLVEAHPEWVNELDKLDALQRAAGIKDPITFSRNPVDLLETAKRFNFYFIGANGNFLPEGTARR
jgi:hypothetical protein